MYAEMNPSDKHTSLLESMHKPAGKYRHGVSLPSWMKKSTPPAHAETQTPENETPPPAWVVWWMSPLSLRISRAGLIATLAIACVAVMVLFSLGRYYQYRNMNSAWLNYERQLPLINATQESGVNTGLIPTTVERNEAPSPAPLERTETPSTNPTAAAAPSKTADPRKAGLNYFRLLQIPATGLDEGQKAVEFLASHGIDAVLISVNNGRSYKLLALRGFDRVSDPETQKYAESLKRLGRLWKAKHKGFSDWQGIYAEKYIPGRT